MITFWLLAGLLGADAPAAANPNTFGTTVTLNICCFRNNTGVAHVTLFDKADTWLKGPTLRAEKRPIAGPNLQVVFKGVPPGRYAGSVLHDENANSKMDMQWFPLPKPQEGSGVTNNAESTFGPPSYDGAAFVLTEQPKAFDVLLRYY